MLIFVRASATAEVKLLCVLLSSFTSTLRSNCTLINLQLGRARTCLKAETVHKRAPREGDNYTACVSR